MECLLVGDLHYRLPQFDWVAETAPSVDVVVIAGDLLDIRSGVPLEAQAAAVSAQIARIGDGHVHQAPFVPGGAGADRVGDTWVFNAGQQPGPVPSHILIDLEAGAATWSASGAHRTVALR